MTYPSVFDATTTAQVLNRLEKLTPQTQPLWGKMNAGQMLAHVNVSYHVAYGNLPVKNNFFMKWLLKTFVKNGVVNEVPYKKSSQTAPYFIIANQRDFEKEKKILIDYIKETEAKGVAYFEGKESVSFGILTAKEWSNMFYKHLDHHFNQFEI